MLFYKFFLCFEKDNVGQSKRSSPHLTLPTFDLMKDNLSIGGFLAISNMAEHYLVVRSIPPLSAADPVPAL
jgi:hypothetical protein